MDEEPGKKLVEKKIMYQFQNFSHAKHPCSDIGKGSYLLFWKSGLVEKNQKKNRLQILDDIGLMWHYKNIFS